MCIEKANVITALIERLGKGVWKLFKFAKEKKKISAPYYFEEYNKKVFVKSNGDALKMNEL